MFYYVGLCCYESKGSSSLKVRRHLQVVLNSASRNYLSTLLCKFCWKKSLIEIFLFSFVTLRSDAEYPALRHAVARWFSGNVNVLHSVASNLWF